MSEEGTQQNPAPAAAATVDNSAIKAQLEEARAEIAKLHESATAQEQRIRAVFQPEEGKNEKLLQALLTSPDRVFDNLAGIAEERAYSRMSAERQKEREVEAAEAARRMELGQAVKKAFDDRPDIATNEGARQLFDKHYITTNANLSEKERVAEAIREMDLALEKLDGKKAEERINAARSARGASGSMGDGAKATPVASADERRADAVQDYMKVRAERYKKVFGRSIPSSGL